MRDRTRSGRRASRECERSLRARRRCEPRPRNRHRTRPRDDARHAGHVRSRLPALGTGRTRPRRSDSKRRRPDGDRGRKDRRMVARSFRPERISRRGSGGRLVDRCRFRLSRQQGRHVRRSAPRDRNDPRDQLESISSLSAEGRHREDDFRAVDRPARTRLDRGDGVAATDAHRKHRYVRACNARAPRRFSARCGNRVQTIRAARFRRVHERDRCVRRSAGRTRPRCEIARGIPQYRRRDGCHLRRTALDALSLLADAERRDAGQRRRARQFERRRYGQRRTDGPDGRGRHGRPPLPRVQPFVGR